jgi:hypothetical protein
LDQDNLLFQAADGDTASIACGGAITARRFFDCILTMVGSGSPQTDAARTIMILRHAVLPAEFPESVVRGFAQARTVLLHTYEETYLERTGFSREELAIWELPMMAARLVEGVPEEEKRKLLAMVQQQASNL